MALEPGFEKWFYYIEGYSKENHCFLAFHISLTYDNCIEIRKLRYVITRARGSRFKVFVNLIHITSTRDGEYELPEVLSLAVYSLLIRLFTPKETEGVFNLCRTLKTHYIFHVNSRVKRGSASH